MPTLDQIFALGPHIRYVAVGKGQHVEMRQREGLDNASEASSDFFEELLVNPTLVTLTRQRGELDCGGLNFLVIGYGSFHEVVVPTQDGHISVGVALEADPVDIARRVAGMVAAQ